MRARALLLAAVLALFACTDRDPWWDSPRKPSAKPALDLPPIDGGRLVTIWNWGKAPPEESVTTVVSDASGTRDVPPEYASHVRWISPSRALVSVDERRVAPRIGSLRLSADGETFTEWWNDRDVSAPLPSPDRSVVALNVRGASRLEDRLEIRRPGPGPDIVASRSLWFSLRAWSPSGDALLLAELPDREGGVFRNQRMNVITSDLRELRPLAVSFRGETPTPASTLALAWTRAGIVARIERWIALCDPDAATCREVWRPDEPLYVVRGVPLGEAALLVGLVDDSDPVALGRMVELRRVDLASGEARLVLRAPENTYLQDFDWIAADAPEPPEAEPPAGAPAPRAKAR